MLAVVHQMLVDLVGDANEIPFTADLREELELRRREHLARGVVGGIDENRPRLLRHGSRHGLPIEAPIRSAQSDEARDRGRHRDSGRVRVVIGLEENDFVLGIADPLDRREDRFGSSGSHRELRVRLVVEAVVAPVLGGERDVKVRGAGHPRVLAPPFANRGDRRVFHERRPIEIGKPLREVDRSVFDRELCDLGEYGRAEARQLAAYRGAHGEKLSAVSRNGKAVSCRLSGVGSRWNPVRGLRHISPRIETRISSACLVS